MGTNYRWKKCAFAVRSLPRAASSTVVAAGQVVADVAGVSGARKSSKSRGTRMWELQSHRAICGDKIEIGGFGGWSERD